MVPATAAALFVAEDATSILMPVVTFNVCNTTDPEPSEIVKLCLTIFPLEFLYVAVAVCFPLHPLPPKYAFTVTFGAAGE